jgi:hypothetical protein
LDFGTLVRESAIEARRMRDESQDRSEQRIFQSGRLMAFYEVISLMQHQAAVFEITLAELRLDGINPDRDLL